MHTVAPSKPAVKAMYLYWFFIGVPLYRQSYKIFLHSQKKVVYCIVNNQNQIVMPIIKRKSKTKESRKKVTPDYVEKTKTKTKGTKPVTSIPTSNPKPSVGSSVSKPQPKKPDGVLITHKPAPGGGAYRPKPDPGYKKPNPGTSIPRPRTKTPIAGTSGKLNSEKLRQTSHNTSMHGQGKSGQMPANSNKSWGQRINDNLSKPIKPIPKSSAKKARRR